LTIAAIYGRKSLFTGKGESIKNQIEACKEYAQKRNWDVIEYYDEGFSGKDTDRPGFQKLLLDIDKKNINHVIFYKLDRISRKMLDILEFIEKTNNQGIGFISITENFDTTTPLGRAMVHIAATFAQLEREMLQQRVRDNMIRLARTGRWLGGVTPTGYEAKQVRYLDENGRTKYKYALSDIPHELNAVEIIFEQYLESKSLGRVEKYLKKQNIKSKNDKYFRKQTIKSILTNPVYIKADSRAYKYFRDLNMDIANQLHEFDGIHGVLTYNKNIIRKGHTNEIRNYNEWILSVGDHNGIIESKKWINVQKVLSRNEYKHPRQNSSCISLLSGLLFCRCGAAMKVKHGRLNKKTGTKTFYYYCPNKLTNQSCSQKNIRGDIVDQFVFTALKKLSFRQDEIFKKLNEVESRFFQLRSIKNHEKPELESQIIAKEATAQRLIIQLESELSELVRRRIVDRIEVIENEIKEYELKLHQISCSFSNSKLKEIQLNIIKEKLIRSSILFDVISDHSMKKMMIEKMIKKVVCNNEELEIFLIDD